MYGSPFFKPTGWEILAEAENLGMNQFDKKVGFTDFFKPVNQPDNNNINQLVHIQTR